MTTSRYRGYQRCSRINYSNNASVFAITLCVKPRRHILITTNRNNALIAEMRRLQDEGYWGVYLYCIMPDHVHLVVNPGAAGLSEAVRRFKGRISSWWRQNGDGQSLWQKGYFDHLIRSIAQFQDKCAYINQNPVRAGLVAKVENYQWSGSLVRR
jgi:REP element-mobilizing transposase RayT